MWFPNRSYTSQAVQSQKQARSLKFRIYEEEEWYFSSSENKGADQLRGYHEADLRLCFPKTQISFAVTAKLISTFVFATQIV